MPHGGVLSTNAGFDNTVSSREHSACFAVELIDLRAYGFALIIPGCGSSSGTSI